MALFYKIPKLEGWFHAVISKIIFSDDYLDIEYKIPNEDEKHRQRYFYKVFSDESPVISFLKFAKRTLEVDSADDLSERNLKNLVGKELIIELETDDKDYTQTINHIRFNKKNAKNYLS
jgi:hypothetical protein